MWMRIKEFLIKNKIIIAIVFGAGIIAFGIYFGLRGRKRSENFDISKDYKSCSDVPELANNKTKTVTRIIDGDTFVIEGGYSVRN